MVDLSIGESLTSISARVKGCGSARISRISNILFDVGLTPELSSICSTWSISQLQIY